jgi:hypothetical protein
MNQLEMTVDESLQTKHWRPSAWLPLPISASSFLFSTEHI